MKTEAFDYVLPSEAIAQAPAEPRDASRLLVTSTLTDHRFSDLPDLLNDGDLLVVNETRVRAARLAGHKRSTGGAIELLLLRRCDQDRWEALVRPARRVRPGLELDFGTIQGTVRSEPKGGVVSVELTTEAGDVDDHLPTVGRIPLPPYFRGELADPERYQTVFATTVGSAAAPTAGLHFTQRLVDDLGACGITIAPVTLDVGLDTFRPMTVDEVDHHQIHREAFEIPAATAAAIAGVRSTGGRVVAVGTTVIRTLETASAGDGVVHSGPGESALFIRPGYRMGVVDAAITNFHAPRTTLIALVAAMLGPAWRDAYATALVRGYRFLSFGDAMFIDQPVNR